MSEPSHARRGFRLSLKTFLILILLIGAWLGNTIGRARRQRLAVSHVHERASGQVRYDWQLVPGRELGITSPPTPAPGPTWLKRWLSDEYFQDVVEVSLGVYSPVTVVPDDIANLHNFPQLTRLGIYSEVESAEVLQQIARFARLEQLTILHGTARTRRHWLALRP